MTALDTTALRKVAEAAERHQPGPWYRDGLPVMGDDDYEVRDCTATSIAYSETGHNASMDGLTAEHIATFDPPTVTALLDEVDDLRAKVARVDALADAADRESARHPLFGGALMPGSVYTGDLRAALDGA